MEPEYDPAPAAAPPDWLPALPQQAEPYAALHARLCAAEPLALPTARVAHAYADSVFAYWQAAQEDGQFDDEESLTILDLHPGSGQFCWQVAQALRLLFESAPAGAPHVQYVACATDAEQQAALLAHPYFDAMAQQDSFFVVLRDDVLASQDAVFSTNLVVVLAHGLMATLPQELLQVRDDGAVSSVLAQARQSASAPALRAVAVETSLAPAGPQTPAAEALLEIYRGSLDGAMVALPGPALVCLDALALVSGGRFLLLCSDHAVDDERAIRRGAFEPAALVAVPAHVLPVNYHALASHLRGAGARAWQDKAAGGVSLLVALLGGGPGLDHVFPALQSTLAGIHGNQLGASAALAARGDAALSDCLAQLLLADADPRCLELLLPTLLAADWSLPPEQLESWRQALVLCWNMYLPGAGDDDFLLDFGTLAFQVGHYGLLRVIVGNIAPAGGAAASAAYMLAEAEVRTGRVAQAIEALDQALALQPEDEALQAMRLELEQRQRDEEALDWFKPEMAQAGVLRLEPLAGHHAEALLAHSPDAQGAAAAMLPPLATLADADAWIAAQAIEPGRMTCAAMHEDWGLVGLTSVRAVDRTGLFYFWTGADYQGQGYGVAAGTAQLLMVRDGSGVEEFFAACGLANELGRRALLHIGFRALESGVEPVGGDLDFLYIGAEDDDAATRPRLEKLCAASGLRLVNSNLAEAPSS